MMKLRADFALGLNAIWPMHNCPVAGAAPMRRHLLGPLVRSAESMRPIHRVVIVGFRSAELVDFADEKLGCFDIGHAIERRHLVETAIGAFLPPMIRCRQ